MGGINEPRRLSEIPELAVPDPYKGHQWLVHADNTIEAIGRSYFIDLAQFGENWLAHLSVKPWVDIADFAKAYRNAYLRELRRKP